MGVFLKLVYVLIFLAVFVLGRMDSALATESSAQIVSSQTQIDLDIQNQRSLEEKIYQPVTQENPPPSTEDDGMASKTGSDNKTKFFVKRIDVQGYYGQIFASYSRYSGVKIYEFMP